MVAVKDPSKLTHSELREEVERLKQVRLHLARQLMETADQLESPGFPPTAALIDELRSYRQRMCSLANALGADPEPDADAVHFVELERLLEARDYRRSADAILGRLTELTHVDIPDFAPLALCRREASRLCELADESPVGEKNSELELLRQQRHPLNSLIRLCDEGDRLSDTEWTESHDDVATTYGRQLATALTRGRIQRTTSNSAVGLSIPVEPLSGQSPISNCSRSDGVAGAGTSSRSPGKHGNPEDRGFRSVQPRPPHFEKGDCPEPVSARVDVSAPILPAPDGAPPTSRIPDAVETRIAEAAPTPDASAPSSSTWENSIFETSTAKAAMFDAVPEGSSLSARLRMTALPRGIADGQLSSTESPVAAAGPVAAPAVAARSDDIRSAQSRDHEPSISPGTTAVQIIGLMTEGRLPLALHLTRCLEQRAEHVDPFPPSWLLRSLILGRHLSYSKGEIARQLDDELRVFRPEMLSEGSAERQCSMAFLLRAAALPAALLAGSAPAVAILRSFKIAPGFSQLYNYSSRIALYGDRLAGSLVEMFRPTGTIACASELAELGQTAKSWLQETARKAVTYGRTSPLFLHAHWTLTAGTAVRHAQATALWCKWQETLSLAHRLLKPVCDQADGERNWVRQEVARLTSQVRIEPPDQSLRVGSSAPQSGRGIVLPLEEMHSVLMEAVAIANRWLRLCHHSASGGASPIPLDALELREEILKRSEGLLVELTQHFQSAESPLVKAAINCCQSTVRQIQALFESRASLPIVESDARHVLNAEMLKISGIELNDQWLPETAPAVVERELIARLQQPSMTWRQSYDDHARRGNHQATGRLLELDVWGDVEQRESLRLLRNSQIAENRAALTAELGELAADNVAVMETGIRSEADGLLINQRLKRLEHELPGIVDFNAFRLRMNQLQATIMRQRSETGMPWGQIGIETESPHVRGKQPAEMSATVAEPCQLQAFDIFSGE